MIGRTRLYVAELFSTLFSVLNVFTCATIPSHPCCLLSLSAVDADCVFLFFTPGVFHPQCGLHGKICFFFFLFICAVLPVPVVVIVPIAADAVLQG